MNGISNVLGCSPVMNCNPVKNTVPAFCGKQEGDVVEIANRPEPPKISRLRLAFGLLKDEQIKQINEAGRLPDNAKFVSNGMGDYTICNNFFNLRAGTQKIPAGFEVRKNVLGFAAVLPEDTNGLFVKDKN